MHEFAGGLPCGTKSRYIAAAQRFAAPCEKKEENSNEIRNVGDRDLDRWRIPC
jgi:hypothetical protein